MATELNDALFSNTGTLARVELIKQRIKGLEEISDDLKEYSGWDGRQPVATLVLHHTDGTLDQCILHIQGFTDSSKRMDARTLLGPQYGFDNHQVFISKLDLAKFRFRGNMISDWLSPTEFDWKVQSPSTQEPGIFRDVDKIKMVEDGGQPIWLRAHVQPWTGNKVKLTLGCYSCKDIKRIQDSEHHRFPILSLGTLMVPLATAPNPNLKLALPLLPYILDDRDDFEDDSNFPTWEEVLSASVGFFRSTSAPHCKTSLVSIRKALEEEWRKDKVSKFVFPALKEPALLVNDDIPEGGAWHVWLSPWRHQSSCAHYSAVV